MILQADADASVLLFLRFCLVDLVETTSKYKIRLYPKYLKFSPLRYASVERTKGIDDRIVEKLEAVFYFSMLMLIHKCFFF